ALEQQTATSLVLQSISRSAFDLQAVLQTVVENAGRLCGAQSGFIFRHDAGKFTHMAHFGFGEPLLERARETGGWQDEFSVDRSTISGRVVLQRGVVQIEDAEADPELGE